MPTAIYPDDGSLSITAMGVLSKMLNLPELDYHTAEELFPHFEQDTPKSVRQALRELTAAEYLLFFPAAKTYAVNKMKIPQMKVV